MTSDTAAVAIVTGAAGGIGRATAIGLAKAGLTVVVVDRDQGPTTVAADEIRQETGSDQVESIAADLSSQQQVRDLAEEINRRFPDVAVLVNNAGLTCPRRTETVDGLEMTWAVNYLAQFLLTNLIADPLAAGTPGRVVAVSSDVQALGRLDLDDTQYTRGHYRATSAYHRSKIATMAFTVELAQRWKARGVTANAVHPGLVRTGIGHGLSPLGKVGELLSRPMARTPERGADTVLYLATSAEVAEVTGQYFIDRQAKPDRINRLARDADFRTRLWDLSAEQAGVRSPST